VPIEDVVFLAFRAAAALDATDKQYGHPNRDQHGQNASVHHKPMRKILHLQSPAPVGIILCPRLWRVCIALLKFWRIMPFYMATHLIMRDPYLHDIVLWESPPIGARTAFRDAGIARSSNADFRLAVLIEKDN
jgi:hypothetical protein